MVPRYITAGCLMTGCRSLFKGQGPKHTQCKHVRRITYMITYGLLTAQASDTHSKI